MDCHKVVAHNIMFIKQDLGGGLNKMGMNLLGVEDLGLKVSQAFVRVI